MLTTIPVFINSHKRNPIPLRLKRPPEFQLYLHFEFFLYVFDYFLSRLSCFAPILSIREKEKGFCIRDRGKNVGITFLNIFL